MVASAPFWLSVLETESIGLAWLVPDRAGTRDAIHCINPDANSQPFDPVSLLLSVKLKTSFTFSF